MSAAAKTLLLLAPLALAAAGASPEARAAQAQPVPIPEEPSTAPQLQFDGVGIGTLRGAREGADGRNRDRAGARVDFSDSALQFGAAQRLYGGAVGSLGLGWLTTEQSLHGSQDPFFLDQAFVNLQSERWELVIGRTDRPGAHPVDLPTLRGDDLIRFTSPQNPYSDGRVVEEQRYSNLAQATLNQGLTWFESVYVQHLINSAGAGSENGVNSFGASLQYLAPPGMEALERVVDLSAGYERSLSHTAYAGLAYNLIPSAVDRLELRLQGLLQWGSALTALASEADTLQADSRSVAAGLRYLHSPFGGASTQVSLTAARKSYSDVRDAGAWGAALTGVRRLGQGFDLVAQYQAERRDAALAGALSGLAFEHAFEVGFVFNFNATINQHINPRRSLLNQRHQYVPE